MALFDPFLIMVVDLSYYYGADVDTGDIFKLYNYYFKRDGSGVVGIVLTLFIYFFLTALNSFLLYFYMIWVHMNGRVIDLYIRLNGDINAFFIPRDDEVSVNYLKWICHKAIKRNQRVTNEGDTVLDDQGKSRPVNFVHIY